MAEDTTLSRTPLTGIHRELGARMVGFAGYEMALNYAPGIVAEHRHCRTRAALFDVSHMGQVEIRPSDGDMAGLAAALAALVPADLPTLPEGRQRYTLLTDDGGGVRDDLMIANLGDRFLAVVNAALREADTDYLAGRLPARVSLLENRALLALQGPEAGRVLAGLASDADGMHFMEVRHLGVAGAEAIVARSGYTGEDGFEISVAAADAPGLFRRLLAADAVEPAGLGARDTLRLEAGLCLMGHDLDAQTSPVEAGLAWTIPRARRSGGDRAGGFPGASRILAELEDGPARRRVGLLPEGRAPVREGAILRAGTETVGRVTSGGFGPSLGRPVAMGYVASAHAGTGTVLSAEQRGRTSPVTVAALPFVEGRQKRN